MITLESSLLLCGIQESISGLQGFTQHLYPLSYFDRQPLLTNFGSLNQSSVFYSHFPFSPLAYI